MAVSTLVDTSALYALLDENEPFHAHCKLAFAEAPSPLVTTPVVLTELFHFLVRRFRNQEGGWRLLRGGQFEVSPISTADLPALDRLMHRYADRAMDFADATLVHVAEREGLRTILTIDHSDFETYRIGRGAKFRILPER
jgi:predicted nucleic acid-binding protein